MKIFVRLLLLWIALYGRFVYAGNDIRTTDESALCIPKYIPVLNEPNTANPDVPISADWIKDYSEPKIISESNYAKLSKLLRSFNKRKDGLRVYVLIAPDFKASVPSDLLKAVDLLALKKVINNLSSEKPTDWEKLERDWDEFLFKEPNKIIESIDNSLARRGHTQRIVLYFRITHFHNPSTDKMESRIFCKINIAGDKLEHHKAEILVKAREGVDLNAKFQHRQKGIITTITNVIDAVKTEYDKKKPAEATCTAGSLSTVIADSKAHKDAIQDFVNLLNKPSHFKSEYFIVDEPQIMEGQITQGSPYSDIKAGCAIPSKEFTTDILPDKLNLLAQNSDYRVYVVLHRVDFMLDNDQREKFAKQVFDASNLKGNSKNILVVVPYYYCFTTTPPEYDGSTRVSPGSMSGPLMFMPAACSGDAAVVKDFNAYFSDFPNWQQAFNKGFAGIPKNYIVYDYKMIWNGDVIYDGIEKYDKVKGFEDIVAVRIVEDSRFDALAQGICIDPRVSDPVRNRRYRDCLKNDYGPKFLAILSQPPKYSVVTETNLKQSTIDVHVARAFALYYSAKKITESKFFENIKFDLPPIDNNLFYAGINPFGPKKGNLFLKVIDIASLVVSPIGMDVIFDGIGAYYCLAIGDNMAAAVYVVGMSLPYVSAAAIHLAKEPVKRAVMAGKSWAFKRASGSYELMANDRLWGNYVFRDQSKILSQYGETALSPDAYIKVATHQENKAFIKHIDDGVDDADALKAINDDPELIDEFHVFYSSGKGTLQDFLKQGIKLALDEDIVKAVLLKYQNDKKFLSAFEKALKSSNEKTLKEINDYPHLVDDFYKKFVQLGRNKDAFVRHFDETRKRIDLLEKLEGYSELRSKCLAKDFQRLLPEITLEEEIAFQYKYNLLREYKARQNETQIYFAYKALVSNNNPSPGLTALSKTLDESLNSLPPHSGKVYMELDHVTTDCFNVPDIQPGERISFNDISPSYAKSLSVVVEETQGISKAEGYAIYLFEITSKTGRKLQDEVFFHAGTRFQVASSKTGLIANKKYVVVLLDEVEGVAAAAARSAQNFPSPITKTLNELDEANLDGFIKDAIEEATRSRNTTRLEELLQLKPIERDKHIVSSGKQYSDRKPMDKQFIAKDERNGTRRFDRSQRRAYELSIMNGVPYFQGRPLPENMKFLYVLSPDGKMYVAHDRLDSGICHSSFLDGNDVSSAGILEFKGGKVYVDNDSGHYHPEPQFVKNAVIELLLRGVNKYDVKYRPR